MMQRPGKYAYMIFVFKLRGAEHDSDVVGSCRETTEIQEISLSA